MDCWVYQEIIWETRPDFVVELGVMIGGATHFRQHPGPTWATAR